MVAALTNRCPDLVALNKRVSDEILQDFLHGLLNNALGLGSDPLELLQLKEVFLQRAGSDHQDRSFIGVRTVSVKISSTVPLSAQIRGLGTVTYSSPSSPRMKGPSWT